MFLWDNVPNTTRANYNSNPSSKMGLKYADSDKNASRCSTGLSDDDDENSQFNRIHTKFDLYNQNHCSEDFRYFLENQSSISKKHRKSHAKKNINRIIKNLSKLTDYAPKG